MKVILTRKGEEILVDDEDFEELNQYIWHLTSEGYARRSITVDGKRTAAIMHRVILDLSPCSSGNTEEPRQVVDHINRIKTDNRKENLRLVTDQENFWNQSLRGNSNTGVKGVTYYAQCKNNPYLAQISFKGKKIRLGSYPTIEEAGAAYEKAREQLHVIGIDPNSITWLPDVPKRYCGKPGPYPKGVSKADSKKNPYAAHIWHEKKVKYLGCFSTVELASQAYIDAAKRYNKQT